MYTRRDIYGRLTDADDNYTDDKNIRAHGHVGFRKIIIMCYIRAWLH